MPHSDANGNRDSHADGNSDADSDTNTDRDANSNSHVYSDSHAYGNAHTDANGYGHRHSDIHAHSDGDCHSYANTAAYCDSNSYGNGDLNAHANCGEAFADAETASNDTATASVARIDKRNFSGGNSRVTLASSRSLRAITWIPFARADATWIALNADNSPAKPLFPMR